MNRNNKEKYHYVYKITDPKTGQFYIGSRTSKYLPSEDSYMGSPYTWEPEDKSRLEKEIIKDDFNNRKEAVEFEAKLIKKNIKDSLNENYSTPDGKFHNNVGKKLSKETIEKIREANSGENHPSYGKSHSKSRIEKIRKNNPNSKKVLDKKTGKVYRSQSEAARQLNINRRRINNHCIGLVKNLRFINANE